MLRRAVVVVSYALLGVAIIAATIILVAVGEGYSYDIRTNQFVLNGLIVLNTAPVSGDVYVNGKFTHHKTPYRTTIQAGDYDLEIRRSGYHTWKKHIVVRASEVNNLEEVVLIPNQLKSESVSSAQAVTGVYTSRDHKHLAYIATDPDAGVWVENLDKKQASKVYSPAAATADRAAETLLGAAWSNDGSHILVTTKVGDATHYVVVPSGGGTAVDLTDVFKFDLSGLTFSNGDWRDLYWVSPEGLRKLNVDSKTVSAPLADKIAAFTLAGDKIIYVQTTSLGKAVYSMDKNGGDQKRLVEALPESDAYELAYSNYRGRDLLAIVPHQTGIATLYLSIYGSTPTSVVVSKSTSHVSFSPDGHYLAFYSETGFGSYDVDLGELALSARNLGPLASLMWFDDFHVVVNTNGQAAIAEADGDNVTVFATVAADSVVYAAGDQHRAITIQAVAGGVTKHLVMTELRP